MNVICKNDELILIEKLQALNINDSITVNTHKLSISIDKISSTQYRICRPFAEIHDIDSLMKTYNDVLYV